MKKTDKKKTFRLSKETVKQLTTKELGQVAGGVYYSSEGCTYPGDVGPDGAPYSGCNDSIACTGGYGSI